MRIKKITTLLFMISIYSVSAQNGYTLALDHKTEPTKDITLNETTVGVTILKELNAKNKIKNTFNYHSIGIHYPLEKYDLQNNFNQFTSLENTFELAHQLSEKTKLIFEIQPTANFQTHFDVKDITIFGGLEVHYVFNKNNSIRVGLKRTSLFGKPEILPSFGFFHRINTNSSLEIGFPNTTLSYSNNSRNKFSITTNFNGSYYYLDAPKSFDNWNVGTKASFSQITSALEYERNMDANWFVSLKGGYDFNKKYTLTVPNGSTSYDFNTNNGSIFNIGIKYKH
jgi:hypothetical protein